MLQPTDRVIAKTLVRILGSVAQTLEPNDPIRAVTALIEATFQNTTPNVELLNAVGAIVKEVRIEMEAEANGTAVSYQSEAKPSQLWDDTPEPRTGAGSLD